MIDMETHKLTTNEFMGVRKSWKYSVRSLTAYVQGYVCYVDYMLKF